MELAVKAPILGFHYNDTKSMTYNNLLEYSELELKLIFLFMFFII